MNVKTITASYTNGYYFASEAINEGGSPQDMYNQSMQSLDQNDFDKGWRQACIENGAKDEEV